MQRVTTSHSENCFIDWTARFKIFIIIQLMSEIPELGWQNDSEYLRIIQDELWKLRWTLLALQLQEILINLVYLL